MDYFQLSDRKSRSISAENFTGEKGKGGMAREGFGQEYARDLGIGWKVSPAIWVEPGETVSLAHIQGQGSIRHIWIVDSCKYNRQLVLRIYWDGREYPSVEAPLCDFFACADYQTYAQLTSAQVCVNPKRAFNCYWEMPFYSQCRITLENLHTESVAVFYQIDYQLREMPAGYAYFHAQFRRSNPLPYKEDHVILEHVQGKGQYVGTYLFWGVNNNGWWGEGEVKFFLDGDGEFPTICTTGTEDYFGGSYNFDTGGQYQEFCTQDWPRSCGGMACMVPSRGFPCTGGISWMPFILTGIYGSRYRHWGGGRISDTSPYRMTFPPQHIFIWKVPWTSGAHCRTGMDWRSYRV